MAKVEVEVCDRCTKKFGRRNPSKMAIPGERGLATYCSGCVKELKKLLRKEWGMIFKPTAGRLGGVEYLTLEEELLDIEIGI